MSRPLASSLAALVLASFLGGCATSTTPGAVGVSRPQLLMVPSAAVDAESAATYSRLSAAAGSAGKLNPDQPLTLRVRGVASRLIGQVDTYRPDAATWSWEVNVFDSDDINAFCAPGGKIGVFSGLVRRLELADEELAAVLGHEIAHALREHTREKLSQDRLSSAIVQGIASTGARYAAAHAALASLGSTMFVRLPFSREMELEADLMGLELMARAGFDPRLAPNVWRKMQAASAGSSGVEFFSTHPDDERRIAQLEGAAPKVLAFYLSAREAEGASASKAADHAAATNHAVQAAAGEAARRPVAPSAPPTPTSRAASTFRVGPDDRQVMQLARQLQCADPRADLVEKGAGVTRYEVYCANPQTLRIVCSFGDCRAGE